MRWRPQRGGLAESLAETKQFTNYAGFIASVQKHCPSLTDESMLEIKPYGGDDDRIGWRDVHIFRWGILIGFVEGDPRELR